MKPFLLQLSERSKIVLLVAAFIAIGFFRDAVFLNINNQLYELYFKSTGYELPPWLSALKQWPYIRLYYFKYFLSAFFILVYFVLSTLAIWFFTPEFQYIRWSAFAYAVVLSLAVITYAVGYLSGHFPKGFQFTRNLIGLLQSPFIAMLLIPACKLIQGFPSRASNVG